MNLRSIFNFSPDHNKVIRQHIIREAKREKLICSLTIFAIYFSSVANEFQPQARTLVYELLQTSAKLKHLKINPVPKV